MLTITVVRLYYRDITWTQLTDFKMLSQPKEYTDYVGDDYNTADIWSHQFVQPGYLKASLIPWSYVYIPWENPEESLTAPRGSAAHLGPYISSMLEGPQKDLLLFYNTDSLGIDGQSHAAVQSASETYVLGQHILGAVYETWSVISSIWYRALQEGLFPVTIRTLRPCL